MQKYRRSDLVAHLDIKASLIPGVSGICQMDDESKIIKMDLDGIDVFLCIYESKFGVSTLALIPEIEIPEYGRNEFAAFLLELNSNLLRGSYCIIDSRIVFKHFITIGDHEKMVEDNFLNELFLPYRMMQMNLTDIMQEIDSFIDDDESDEYRILTEYE